MKNLLLFVSTILLSITLIGCESNVGSIIGKIVSIAPGDSIINTYYIVIKQDEDTFTTSLEVSAEDMNKALAFKSKHVEIFYTNDMIRPANNIYNIILTK